MTADNNQDENVFERWRSSPAPQTADPSIIKDVLPSLMDPRHHHEEHR